jgi:hypothetical protein
MSVGRNAKQAIVFLKSFYRDLQSLMVTCEQQLGEQGWKPPASSQIGELSNSLRKPHRWVLDSVFRSFICTDRPSEALVIVVLLNVKQFDDAQVLAVHCHFDKPAKHERIWHRWTNASRMIEFLATDPGMIFSTISAYSSVNQAPLLPSGQKHPDPIIDPQVWRAGGEARRLRSLGNDAARGDGHKTAGGD